MVLSSQAGEPPMTQPALDGRAEVDVLSAKVKDGVVMVVPALASCIAST